jgi:hypothetical protein
MQYNEPDKTISEVYDYHWCIRRGVGNGRIRFQPSILSGFLQQHMEKLTPRKTLGTMAIIHTIVMLFIT